MRRTPESLIEPPARPGDEVQFSAAAEVLENLLDTLTARHVGVGRFELATPWGIQLPHGDLAYLVVVGSGGALLEVDGAPATLTLAAGDVVLVPRGGAHQLRDAKASPLIPLGERECRRAHAGQPIQLGGDGPPATLVICAVRFRAAHRTLSIQHLAPSVHLLGGDPAASPGLLVAAQLLITESSSRRPGATVVMNRLADILLVEAIRAYVASRDCPAHGLRARTDPQIARALALIHRHPDHPWTVEQLAGAVALSRSTFATRFSTLVGAPPGDYLTRWRIATAAELLRDGALTTSQIAARSGYGSEASFNRAFKRIEGLTPGAYRRQQA